MEVIYRIKVIIRGYSTTKREKFNNFDKCKEYGNQLEEKLKSTNKGYQGYVITKDKDNSGTILYESTYKIEYEDSLKKEREEYLNKVKEEQRLKRIEEKKIYDSWGITESDIFKRNNILDIESAYELSDTARAIKDLEKAKIRLKNLIFNHKELIEKARKDIDKKTEKLNKLMKTPEVNTFYTYDETTHKYKSEILSQENITKLWNSIGGKDKWEKIDLTKRGPIQVD